MHVKIQINTDSNRANNFRVGLGTISQLATLSSSPFSKASVEVSVEVIFLTELVCQRDAGKQLTPLTLDWIHIEEHHKAGEDS